jgi:signal transduction histidine kinase
MIQAERIAQNLTALGFVLLGAATALEWYRHRGHAQAMLTLSLVSLAIVSALGRLQGGVGAPVSVAIGIVNVVAFMASAYFIALFRDAFLPLSRRSLLGARVLLVAGCAAGIASVTVFAHASTNVMTALAVILIFAWAILTGEPIVRFWLASRTLPSVQKARMRALSFGFAVLIAILVVAVLGGSALQSPLAVIVIQLIALAMVPVIYASFAPPSLLRRIWRMGEEAALRDAVQDLLIFSPNRQELAEKAAGWAKRLLGASGAFIVDSEGAVMGRTGIDGTEVDKIMSSRKWEVDSGIQEPLPGRSAAIVLPLRLTEGTGFLGVTGGPFTPLFGSDEVNQLQGYASAVTAGLERARVTERLAAIEKNKTQFLNLASHELRGPLTVVRGYISMLEGGLLGNLNERGRKAMPVISAKVLEMNALIEQMIEAARLEDGALMLRPEDADLRDIVSAAMDSAVALVDSKHQLRAYSPEQQVRVRVDVDRVKTIITNLISNAIKYSPAGGPIDVELVNRGGIARVAVTDTGVGIAKDDLPILFTRFGRVSTSQTVHLPGTGLGLYLGRQLARLHGGEITVDSAPGRGSTFTLHLPLSVTGHEAREPQSSTGAQLEVKKLRQMRRG